MKKVRLLLTTCLVILAVASYAQTTHVLPDGGDLQEAIDAAADGDILELVDGGIYETSTVTVPKGITIKAADGAVVRPTIISTGSVLFKFGETMTHYGFKLEGIRVAAHRYNSLMCELLRNDSLSYIVFDDIECHDFGGSIIQARDGAERPHPIASLDSLVVTNCNFYEQNASYKRSCFYLDRDDVQTGYIELSNSSFDGFYKKFLDCGHPDYKKTVVIDHINVVNEDPFTNTVDEDLFEIRGDSGQFSSITITNSIFGHQFGAKLFDFSQKETAIVDSLYNCMFFDIDTAGTMKNDWIYIKDWTEADPLFSHDSVNAMYLTAGSPALTASTTGGPIGDPRWWTLPDPASLYNLKIDGGQYLRPMFRIDHYSYTATIPYTMSSLEVIAHANFKGATIVGDGEYTPAAGGTEKIDVVVTPDGGGTTKTYTINLTREAAATDATLGSLLVRTDTDTFDLVPTFDPATLAYNCDLPIGTDTVYVDAEANDQYATVTYNEMVIVALGNNLTNITVAAQDTTVAQMVYELNLKLCGTGSDATLSEITYDGDPVPGFDPGTLDYTIELEEGTTVVPVIDAVATDTYSFVTIEQAPDVNGTATIVVDAIDCETSLTYTVNFNVTGVDLDEVINLYMVHNSEIDRLSIFNARNVEWVEIYNITGKLVLSKKVDSQDLLEIGTGNLTDGLYLVRMKGSSETYTGKFLK